MLPTYICCPNCQGALASNDHHLTCRQCGQNYPVNFDIPDLRWPRPDDDHQQMALINQLLDSFTQSDFTELVSMLSITSAEADHLVSMYADYRLDIERGRKFYRMFREKWANIFGLFSLPTDAAVDLGCGTGKGLLPLAAEFNEVLGIEPDLPSLLLAKKLLQQEHITNVQLVQAYAQALPVVDNYFSWSHAQNVLDHLFRVSPAFAEIHRILKPGGAFCADSHNRFDIFSVEPHVKIRGVGWLPRAWMKPYVKLRTGEAYEGIHLLSIFEVKRAFAQTFGRRHFKIVFPNVEPYGYPAKLNKFVALIDKIPLLNFVILAVFPSQVTVAQKSN